MLIGVFVAFVLALFGAYWKQCWSQITNIKQELQNTLEILNSFEQHDFNNRFTDINELLASTDYLVVPWQDYRKSLIKKEEMSNGSPRTVLYCTSAANDYFTLSAIAQKADIPFWQNAGGYFTGLGILGTFVGLVIGLYGLDVTSPDITVLKNGIAGLLSGIKFSFVTSIIGVICALLFNFRHKAIVSSAVQEIDKLVEKLESMYPRLTVEQLLVYSWEENIKQTSQLRTLSTDMSERLGELFDNKLDKNLNGLVEKLDNNLKPIFEKMLVALEGLNSNGADAIAGAIDSHSGAAMDSLADTLLNLKGSIEANIAASQNVSQATNDKLMHTVDLMANAFTSNAEKAAQRQEESMNATVTNMQQMLQQMQTSLDKTIKEITATSEQANERIKQTTEATDATASNIVNTFGEMVSNQKSLLEKSSQGIVENMQSSGLEILSILEEHKTSMERTYSQFNEMSNATKDLLQVAAKSINRFEAAAQPVESASAKLKEQLNLMMISTDKANDNINNNVKMLISAANTTENNIKQLRSGMADSVAMTKNAWATYKENLDGLGGDLEQSLNVITTNLNKYNAEMREEISDNLKKFDHSFSTAVSTLGSAVVELQETIDELVTKK